MSTIAKQRIKECLKTQNPTLDLSACAIINLSKLPELVSCTHLKKLDLGGNELSDLTPLKNLHNLNWLELGHNRLRNLIPLQNLHNLTYLGLGYNRLRDLSSLQNLLNITELNLNNNRLSDLSPLRNLYNLKELWLSENQLRDLTPLPDLRNLTYLGLGYNPLLNLSTLQNVPNLTHLGLMGNRLRDLLPLQNMYNLKELWLNYNQICDLSPLQNLHQLTRLDLEHNQLRDLSPLKNLQQLTHLLLNGNQISDFSPLLLNKAYRSKKLRDIDPYGNPNPIINKIVVQGYDALKAYYDEQNTEGHIQNDQLKIVLLGNSTAGKTSLLRYWERREFSENQTTTHGIATPLKLPLRLDDASETFRVNAWDFGGQDYFHATHRLFVTPDSTYILVCNQALENKPESELTTEYVQTGDHIEAVQILVQHYPYRFWLQTMAFLTKAEPIHTPKSRPPYPSSLPKLFLVENKCGTYESKKRMQLDDDLATTLPFDVIRDDFYHLDIREAWRYHTQADMGRKARQFYDGYLDFEETLVQTLQAQIQANRYEVHRNYPVIRDVLAILAAYQQQTDVSVTLNQLLADNKIAPIDQYEKLPVWITYAQYQDMVRKNSKSADPHWASLHIYLQNLCGRMFHFCDIPALADVVFIDPNWLHQTIYKVLSQEVLQNNGEFTLAEADAVIDGNILDAARFMEVMKTFELVFEIPDQQSRRFVAPQYLPVACPLTPGQLKKTKTVYHQLALTLQFPHYLPPSLISRIISLKGHLIKAAEEPLWRNGLIYSEGGLSIFLLCTPNAHQIEVFISQADSATHQKALRQLMAFMEAKFSDEIAEVLITLHGVTGTPKWNHVYRAKKERKTGTKNYDRSTGYELVDSRNFAFLFADFERKPINVFVCYAHEDNAEMVQLVEPLKKELTSFATQHNLVINPFTDQQLRPGDRWDEVLQARIKENDLLICLLSPSFFNSGYIQHHEYGRVMREIAAGERDSLIAPIYLKPCYVAEANPIGNLQFFKPLPTHFGLGNDIQDFSFHNLLHHNGGSYVRNYVKGFVDSISTQLVAMWETK